MPNCAFPLAEGWNLIILGTASGFLPVALGEMLQKCHTMALRSLPSQAAWFPRWYCENTKGETMLRLVQPSPVERFKYLT